MTTASATRPARGPLPRKLSGTRREGSGCACGLCCLRMTRRQRRLHAIHGLCRFSRGPCSVPTHLGAQAQYPAGQSLSTPFPGPSLTARPLPPTQEAAATTRETRGCACFSRGPCLVPTHLGEQCRCLAGQSLSTPFLGPSLTGRPPHPEPPPPLPRAPRRAVGSVLWAYPGEFQDPDTWNNVPQTLYLAPALAGPAPSWSGSGQAFEAHGGHDG